MITRVLAHNPIFTRAGHNHSLLLISTQQLPGFFENPSIDSNPSCLNTISYLLNNVPTINPNSIPATFWPTQALGP